MAPSQARELSRQVFGEASEAITTAGFTPATAARRARFPAQVVEEFVARKKLIGSFALGRLLRGCEIAEATVERLVTAMSLIEEAHDELPLWKPPALDVPDSELRVADCVGLAKLLLHLEQHSGLPRKQLALQAGIPRSQLYNLINPGRRALPRSRDQLYAFLRTCSLSERQTELVLRQWDQLDQHRRDAPVTPTAKTQRALVPAPRKAPEQQEHPDPADEDHGGRVRRLLAWTRIHPENAQYMASGLGLCAFVGLISKLVGVDARVSLVALLLGLVAVLIVSALRQRGKLIDEGKQLQRTLEAALVETSRRLTSAQHAESSSAGAGRAGVDAKWPIGPVAGEPPLTLFRGKELLELPAGSELDRFGGPNGNLTYAAGTAFDERSLPPEWINRPYHVYRVQRPLETLAGVAIPWFNQPGGGSAYLLPASIEELLANGTLIELEPGEPPID